MVEVDDPHCLDGALMPSQNPRLFGHDAAQTFLATAYRCRRLHHAILIEGPEGVGKATLAFRFAYHLLTHPEPSSAHRTRFMTLTSQDRKSVPSFRLPPMMSCTFAVPWRQRQAA